METFEISKPLLDATIKYLETCPIGEAVGIWSALKQLKPIIPVAPAKPPE